MLMLRSLVFSCALLACGAAYASDFTSGPVITEYGPVADVPGAPAIAAGTTFKVLFSVSEAGEAGALNRRLESAARFLNMQVRAGVPRENIHLAIVVHGAAARDLTSAPREGAANANAGLIAALIANGVEIWVCGQTAAAMDIDQEDLLPGVRMALSAMTANALLQQNGYTLNPG